MFTRQQIDSIAIGQTKISASIDGVHFGEPTRVVEIFAIGVSVRGHRYVCGYREYGEGARISFSISEADATDARLYRIHN